MKSPSSHHQRLSQGVPGSPPAGPNAVLYLRTLHLEPQCSTATAALLRKMTGPRIRKKVKRCSVCVFARARAHARARACLALMLITSWLFSSKSCIVLMGISHSLNYYPTNRTTAKNTAQSLSWGACSQNHKEGFLCFYAKRQPP